MSPSPDKAIQLANGGRAGAYPVALASHDDVVRDPTLFINTLRSFHASLGSKFQIPVIGGKELNLHILYGEVTRRGGYDKVVNDKKWREISTVFDFPPTTTSASYALRKHYHTLLHGYEQLYFFKLQAQTGKIELNQVDNTRISYKAEPPSFQATGTIHGKIDCGYLVSVQLGDETLNGVLYHTGCPGASSSVPSPQPITAIIPYRQPHLPGHRTRRRRRRTGDPNRPKFNRSGYNFSAEKHSMLKPQYPNTEREFTKMIGESWNKLSPQEREVYQNYGVKDKERYQREMKEHRERFGVRQHN